MLRPKQGVGRMPTADVAYHHVKTSKELLSEVYKVNRLLGASGNSHFAGYKLTTKMGRVCHGFYYDLVD